MDNTMNEIQPITISRNNKVACAFEKVSFETFGHTQYDYDKIKLPVRSTSGSAGYDFFYNLNDNLTIKPNESAIIPTGIKAYISNSAGIFLALVPRSSYGFKYGTVLANTIGIIDSDYYNNKDNEGHIMVKLTNHGDKDLVINPGDKFCQGIFLPYFITQDDVPLSDTRTGGIGSTGK